MKKGTYAPTFATHLSELRARIFWILLFFIILSLISFNYYDYLLSLLTKPLGQSLYFTSPTGGLDVVIRICLISGFVLTLPIIMFHLYKFLEPVLSKKPRETWMLYVFASFILAASGIFFAYFIGLPIALTFLKGFGNSKIQPLITTTEYFSFITYYILGFAFVFQLPVIMILTNSIRPFRTYSLLKNSRYVVLVSFIAAAIITPTTDIFNLLLMALPIVFLYFASIAMVFLLNRGSSKI